MKKLVFLCATCFAVSSASVSVASELVYVPTNPSFGGNPHYGNYLLSSAQATSKHKEDMDFKLPGGASGTGKKSALEQFNETLERSILSRLAASATADIIGSGGLTPGTVETGNFIISITDIGNGMLLVTTTDKVTGASTSFQVGS